MSTALPNYESSLSEISARCQDATPGPWRVAGTYIESTERATWTVGVACEKVVGSDEPMPVKANAEFIANARTDVEVLVDEVERLRAVLRHIAEGEDSEASEYAREHLDAGNLTD